MTARALAGLADALGFAEPVEHVLAAVRRIYDEVDDEVVGRAAGLSLPCREGCSHCCHEAVFLSAPELLLVAEHLLEHWGAAARETLVASMCQLAERYRDELELLETVHGPERDEVAARVKFRCPFLDADERCSVYDVRELNARTFGATIDEARGSPFGCELTHARLRVLTPTPVLAGARQARQRLATRFSDHHRVHVYPWWFERYGGWVSPVGQDGHAHVV